MRLTIASKYQLLQVKYRQNETPQLGHTQKPACCTGQGANLQVFHDFATQRRWDKHAQLLHAGPDGNWVLEPVVYREGLITAELNIQDVFKERQNFDPSGHYSRPDVLQLHLNTERQGVLKEMKR